MAATTNVTRLRLIITIVYLQQKILVWYKYIYILFSLKIYSNIYFRLTIGEQIAALFRKSSCKPFWILMIYILITQLSGVTILIMWAVEFLQVLFLPPLTLANNPVILGEPSNFSFRCKNCTSKPL